jgi:hypothetical protein
MFVQTAGSKLILKCKDCHRLVTDSETNSYRLIAGVLYGWCDECFKDRPSERTASQNAAATRCQDQHAVRKDSKIAFSTLCEQGRLPRSENVALVE